MRKNSLFQNVNKNKRRFEMARVLLNTLETRLRFKKRDWTTACLKCAGNVPVIKLELSAKTSINRVSFNQKDGPSLCVVVLDFI